MPLLPPPEIAAILGIALVAVSCALIRAGLIPEACGDRRADRHADASARTP